ncbi:MAG: hypothetical protein K6G83_01980 [Lachnospiraceae bacterium]|nr:hypothetical protein [Lachnospiraceae bacterium]
MKVISMKLADLKRPERNVRIHTEKQLQEFERSVEMFGQIRPIVVDENNVILAGNGLYDTLLKMGRKTADVYKYENLTENQKKKLMIADNKIFTLGIENLDTLNAFLEDLQGDLDIPGYDEDILRQMVSDAEDVTGKIAEYGVLDPDEIQGIRDSAAKRAEMLPTQMSGTSEENPNTVTSELIQAEQDEETTEIKKFLICPKCGEKIWL